MKVDTLYQTIALDLKKLIESRTYRPGEKLPSVRKLSNQWNVSIATIQSAYLELQSQGLIYSQPRAGFFVESAFSHLLPEPLLSSPANTFNDPGEGHLSTSLVDSLNFGPDLIPFGIATLDPNLFPISDLHRSLTRVSRRAGSEALVYDFVPGSIKLRQQLSKLCVRSGLCMPPEEFVLTNGAIEAFHVCLRAVAKTGDLIAVESPTYYGFLRAIQNMQMRPLEIPTHPREGIDLGCLNTLLKKHKVSSIMTVSNYSNPLGCTIPIDRKKDLVCMAKKFNVPIIENDIFGDLPHFGDRPSVCKAYDQDGMVLLCSSFSKTLSPGYRVGWTAPGKYKSRVEWLIHESTFASSTLMRLSIAEYLASSNYQKHLLNLRRHCASQVQQMSMIVSNHFPKGTRLTRPEGGFILWVEFPEKLNSFELHRLALAHKISITPGPVFSSQQQYQNCIRLSCGYPITSYLEQAIAKLGKLATQLISISTK